MLKSAYSIQEADDITNLAFIGGKTNRAISDKEPTKYVPALLKDHGKQPFDAQAIPTKMQLLEKAAYKQFLAERRKQIATRLNEYLTQ